MTRPAKIAMKSFSWAPVTCGVPLAALAWFDELNVPGAIACCMCVLAFRVWDTAKEAYAAGREDAAAERGSAAVGCGCPLHCLGSDAAP